ncbi:MAG: hypothetical protein DME25_10670 [Verrucomicrobia bacterium]|nr:MAG: hypothetical protein DME25_10670 [Verrucomicrobiota bacterium]
MPYLETLLLNFVMRRSMQCDQCIKSLAFLHFLEAALPRGKIRASHAQGRLAFFLGVHGVLGFAQQSCQGTARQWRSTCKASVIASLPEAAT